MTLQRMVAWGLGMAFSLSLFLGVHGASASNSVTPLAAEAHEPMSDAAWAALFDRRVPLADRQHIIAKLEQSPDLKNPHDLYVLGSLYHMGQYAEGSPVQEDWQKASLYLGNAAIHGSVLAMAKMAELKYAEGQYREAMNWAQLYSHYALLTKNDDTSPQESYAAELVSRIMGKLDESAMPAVMKDVNSFVAAHDMDIRAGMAKEATLESQHPHSDGHHYYLPPFGQRFPTSGFADYLVAFQPDGTVANILVMDAVPQPEMGAMLRDKLLNMRIKPAMHDKALRYAWVPLILGDHSYRFSHRH